MGEGSTAPGAKGLREEHSRTLRQEMAALLEEREMTARDLSRALRICEKEVYDHLNHVGRSALTQGKKLVLLPFKCLACGYTFEDRKRLSRPGRCPRCKSSHLETPTYRLY